MSVCIGRSSSVRYCHSSLRSLYLLLNGVYFRQHVRRQFVVLVHQLLLPVRDALPLIRVVVSGADHAFLEDGVLIPNSLQL